jgi:alkanesulfonate monooxygenase SsuD/methylene tetrahydromethanopterin reductase-like flavin-dependent oxidoreductase (luciferase family)
VEVGITLPQFREDATDALAAAREAERVGLHGIFVFDHLWAIGEPERPALGCWPLLGALAVETSSIALGTLVARVGLHPNGVLAHQFATVRRLGGEGRRVIAGLGTGDRLSEAENVAYGVAFPPLAERLEKLRDACRRTRALGLETWVGGTSPALRRVAASEADALNLWDVGVDEIRREAAHQAVTWGGVVDADAAALGALLRSLREAGARWAVCAPRQWRAGRPQESVAIVAEAAALA